MKVLGILCSPRKSGNSAIMLAEAMAAASEREAEVKTVWLMNKDIRSCDGCLSCLETEKCHINDDMTELYELVMGAEAIVFATPVYNLGPPGQAKTFLDRLFALGVHNKLAGKVGATLICGSSIGHEFTWDQFNHFFTLTHMVRADHVLGFAWDAGDIRRDHHAILSSRELGRQVVALAEQHYRFPDEWPSPIYSYVASRYGVHTCPAMGRMGEPIDGEDSASKGKG